MRISKYPIRLVCSALMAAAVCACGNSSNPAAAPGTGTPSPGAGDPTPVDVFAPGKRVSVPKAKCQAGDNVEPGLQGRVAAADLAKSPFNCNLALVAYMPDAAVDSLDNFHDCAYYGKGLAAGGAQVVDVANSALPVPTGVLATPAMVDPWESLRVNVRRKLLAGDSNTNQYLDIYDISGDCRVPLLLSSTQMPTANGHEGWFSPDGMTYFMSGRVPLTAVDISDPANPKEIVSQAFDASTHGGSTTEDGSRSYVCQQAPFPNDKLLILDTSEIAARKPGAKFKVISEIPLMDNQWCQGAYRVTYKGKPFLFQYGERSSANDCSMSDAGWATFAYPRIYDIADEKNPKLISTMMLESALPQHCQTVKGEGSQVSGFGYSVHHCTPDRLYDPTIMACSWFGSGMRVMDIRDPYHPKELAYYNPAAATSQLGIVARPVVRAEKGEIWFTGAGGGFYVVKFEAGVWPFPGSAPCPEANDYFYHQQNPDSACATAKPIP